MKDRIKQQWQNLAQRVDVLSLRERVLIFMAAALVLVTLVNVLLIDPQLTRQDALSRQMKQTQLQTMALQEQIRILAAKQSADPDAPLQKRLQQLREELAGVDTSLLDFQSGLVSPQQMPAMLKDMLLRNDGLRLVSFETLPRQNLAAAVAEAAAQGAESRAAQALQEATQAGVFRHGVKITVEGSYPALVHYLEEMESLPWQMFWGRAELKTGEYPNATLALTLYTLSLEQAWLTI
ncbi:MAG: MSHA biogenesis protein MshJ [Pseudomonadota bacterium]